MTILQNKKEEQTEKSQDAFRTIGEVATEINIPQHVLRFWETKFKQIQPVKGPGGRRYYRPEDIETIQKIKKALYLDGFTIKGVQKLLASHNKKDDKQTNPLSQDALSKKEEAPSSSPHKKSDNFEVTSTPKDNKTSETIEIQLKKLHKIQSKLKLINTKT